MSFSQSNLLDPLAIVCKVCHSLRNSAHIPHFVLKQLLLCDSQLPNITPAPHDQLSILCDGSIVISSTLNVLDSLSLNGSSIYHLGSCVGNVVAMTQTTRGTVSPTGYCAVDC